MSGPATTSVVVFTRDLRVRDHPALVAAAAAERVVPLFVLDDDVLAAHSSVNRTAFLLDCLADLRDQLQGLGADLVVRRGSWQQVVLDVAVTSGAGHVHLSADVSGLAQRRDAALGDALAAEGIQLLRHQGITVVPPGRPLPAAAGTGRCSPLPPTLAGAPGGSRSACPPRCDCSTASTPASCRSSAAWSRHAVAEPGTGRRDRRAGATAGLGRRPPAQYEDRHNLPGDDLQHLGHLPLGCLSPLEVARVCGTVRAAARSCVSSAGGTSTTRRWRGGRRPHEDYRPRGDHWRDDPTDLAAWAEGRTGFPIVDAGMRQLLDEGFMHNRTRMIVASFLTKDLYVDWRDGAAHFMSLLADGDVANNQLNWQWTAGTGTDTNPNRIFNPTVQSKRFDPEGDYIRRHVPELADVPAPEVHEPSEATRARVGYPAAIVDHHEAIAAYRAQLASGRG
jgi:deoxyribodipyrimidine photo-lyase